METFKPDLRKVLPPFWKQFRELVDGVHYIYQGFADNKILSVIISGAVEQDGKKWIHLSCCVLLGGFGTRIPTWEEMCLVKNTFLDEEATAYQIHPPKSKYVNINPSVLHMWCCVEGPVTPDFTRGTRSL